MRAVLLTLPLALLFWGCTDADTQTPDALRCIDCEDGEFCLVYVADTPEETTRACAAVPAACEGDDSCDCRGEMYDACEAPSVGVGCSDTLDVTQISCN